MDIKVMSTMGLTEADLDAIRAVDGVLDAEGSYATDVLCTIRGNQVAVHVMALQDKMNQVQLEDGRLPEKENAFSGTQRKALTLPFPIVVLPL